MLEYADRQIAQLSGGQQQRVFIARSLAQQADIYLMDEPFAGVDAASESAILDILKQLKEEGKTVVIVHHDLANSQRLLRLDRFIKYTFWLAVDQQTSSSPTNYFPKPTEENSHFSLALPI